jgi:hypothetical protein
MRLITVVCLALVITSCKNKDKLPTVGSIQGAWILLSYSANGQKFWESPNQVPLGFRFYSTDSAEVYRTNDYAKPERFVPYKITRDSLSIFHSDSLGWWKQRAITKGDSLLTVYVGSDTLVYGRLLIDNSYTEPKFKKIILTVGSGWGGFISAVLYPNGKTCIYLNPRNGKSKTEFFIRQTPRLYSKFIESYYWATKILDHDKYRYEFWPKFNPGINSDGDFSEILMTGTDSVLSKSESAMPSYQMDMLGLQGYAFNKIIKEFNPRSMLGEVPDSITCDSVRKVPLPVCMLESISNHLAVVTLVAESMNSGHELKNYPRKELNFYFKTRRCSINEEKTFRTDGRIIEMGGAYYDIGFNFIHILQSNSVP